MGREPSTPARDRQSQLYRRKDSPYWWCWYHGRDGVRYESTKCADKRAARLYLSQRERDAQDPDACRARDATLRAALDALVEERESQATSESASRSISTAAFYHAKAKRVLAHFGREFALTDVTAEALDEFVGARRASKIADSTIHKELTTIRAALRIAQRRRLWTGSIEAVLPIVSGESEARTRFLSRLEVDRVLADLTTIDARADRAARVAFAIATSAEWSATTRARREDVSAARDVVRVRGEKRETREREVPIVRPWQGSLLAFALEHADGREGLLFKPWSNSNSNRELGRCARRLGIEAFSWTDLRRTCAQWLRADGVSLELVSAVLGHADTRMVSRVYGRMGVATLADRIRADVARVVNT